MRVLTLTSSVKRKRCSAHTSSRRLASIACSSKRCRTKAAMSHVIAAVPEVPLCAKIIEGGKTENLSAQELTYLMGWLVLDERPRRRIGLSYAFSNAN